MSYEDIIVEVTDHIALITINRPDKLNALRKQTKAELSAAIDTLSGDKEVRGIIITGSGRGFIAGSDISEISIDRPGSETTAMSREAQELMNRIENLPKPVLAAINGYALGGGLELALACDLRIAAAGAKMGLPEIDLGVAPCYGGTQRLPRLIGTGRAKELLYLGKKLTAEEAVSIGLINKVSAPGELLTDAFAIMRSITDKSMTAIAYMKRLVNEGMELPIAEAMDLESRIAGEMIELPDAREGTRAFLEKRKPVFNK